MSESIKKSDIIQGDPFGEIAKQISDALGYLVKFDDVVKQTAKDLTALTTASTKTVQGIDAINKAEKESARLVQEKIRNDKALEKMRLEEIRINKAREKSIDDYNKKAEKEAKIAKDSANAYKILERATRDQKNESKRLGAELLKLEANGEKNTVAFRKLAAQYKATTTAAQKGDAQLKKLDKTVGDGFRSVGLYEKGLDGLKSSFGRIGAALGVGAIAGGIFSINKELDKATNTARMFFGESEAGTKALAQEAIILGKTWGKETNEILAAANVLTKEFGISGEEALAKINEGFNKGADVQGEFIENIKEYSSQLTQAGLTADQSIALITQSQQQGVFSDKGVDAIKEATLSLREMTQPAKDALAAIGMSGDELQRQIQSGELTYFEAMQKITAKTKEFGTGSQQAGMILADVFKGAGEDAGKFIFELDKMNLNLEDMGETSKGLDAAMGNLTRVFYDWLFGVNEAGGVTEKFAGAVQFLADNFDTIVSTLWEVIKLYGYYKAASLAINLKEQYLNWREVSKGVKETGDGLQTSADKAKGFGNALKGIGFGLAITAALELVSVFYDMASGADAARDAAARLDAQLAKSAKDAAARTSERTAEADRQINELQRLRNENKITEKEFLEQKRAITDATKDEVKADIQKVNARKQGFKDQLAELQALQKQYDKTGDAEVFVKLTKKADEIGKQLKITGDKAYGFLESNASASEVVAQLTANIQGTNARLKEYYTELGAVGEATKDLTSDLIVETSTTNKSTAATREKTKASQDLKNTVEDSHLTLEQMHAAELKRLEDEKAALEAVKELSRELNAEMAGDSTLVDVDPEVFTEKELRSLGVMTDAYKEQLQIAQQFQTALTQIATDEIDKRIELAKKEQDAAKSQQDYLQQLAANGNITAQQSIAETIEIQRAAQEEQMRLEKQKQNIELISAGLSTFNSSLSAGKTPAAALAETLVSTNVLVGMLKNLNFYEKGTDNAPGGLAVVDEKGAEIITDKSGNIKEVGTGKGARFTMLSKGDKVYNATKTASIFDAISNQNAMSAGTDSAGNGYDLMLLNGTLKEMHNTMKNQPHSQVDWGGISGGIGRIIENKQVGRTRIVNRYEV